MKNPEKFWDIATSRCDKTEKRFEAIHIKVVKNTKRYFHENETVLDYGCATGTKTFALAGHAKRIHDIDISSDVRIFYRIKEDIENMIEMKIILY